MTELNRYLLVALRHSLPIMGVLLISLSLPACNSKGPSVTIRGKPVSAACKSARRSFDRCMKRAGPTGLKGCQSEFVTREERCRSAR